MMGTRDECENPEIKYLGRGREQTDEGIEERRKAWDREKKTPLGR